MKEETQQPQSGNIFGWKFSFISLIIILITLFAVIIFDDPDKKRVKNPPLNLPDSVQVDSVNSNNLAE